MKAVELAVENIAALINNETKTKKEEKMNTENNTNAAAEILVKDKIFEQQEFIDSKILMINLKKI